jgi:hypothetical protein
MRNITICICIATLMAVLAVLVAAANAQDQVAPKVLRVGAEKTKPINDLDRYGSKPEYNIMTFSDIKPIQNLSMFSRAASVPKAVFNASLRGGTAAKFTYNTGIFRPLYNVSAYSRIKPVYEVPSALNTKPVYNIAGYPNIKAVNSIP